MLSEIPHLALCSVDTWDISPVGLVASHRMVQRFQLAWANPACTNHGPTLTQLSCSRLDPTAELQDDASCSVLHQEKSVAKYQLLSQKSGETLAESMCLISARVQKLSSLAPQLYAGVE